MYTPTWSGGNLRPSAIPQASLRWDHLPIGESLSTTTAATPQAGTIMAPSNASTGSGMYFTTDAAGARSSTGDSALSRLRSIRTGPLMR